MYMNLTIRELNEIIYALGVAEYKGMFVDKETNISAGDKVRNELERVIKEADNLRESIKITSTEKLKENNSSTKVITPITDTGSEVADFLIAVTAQLPEPSEEKTVKKSNFPGAKKSNLMNPEK
jgi:hypothetical protein